MVQVQVLVESHFVTLTTVHLQALTIYFYQWENGESYGSGGLITPITLALMEDLGVYLADYTKSTLPNLGAFAGCDFVNTRCRHQDENGITDQTYETVASTEECEGWVNK